MGKGDTRRPAEVTASEYAANFDRVFGVQDPEKEAERLAAYRATALAIMARDESSTPPLD